MKKIFLLICLLAFVPAARADSLFFEDEPVKDGIPVFEVSDTFADIYQKLDDVKWAGKNINVAIESLEKLNKHAHIAATDERVVLVWDDTIVANYPRPKPQDWRGFGEITTALILQMRGRDATLQNASVSEIYKKVVDSLMRGIDENGRYIYSREAEVYEDGRILTSVGINGARDERGNFRVTGVYKGAPADTAGINAGDLIAEINGADVAKMSDAELAAVMSGFNSGTSKILLLTPTGNRNVVLRRATVVLADADIIHRVDAENGGILEIVVHEVTENAVSIVGQAVTQYADVSGIILDLRAARGDDARAAAKLAGLFIGAQPVLRIVETAMDEVEVVAGGAAITDAPLVVLMSDQTRGTAEAIVAAIYDNERGVLVGTPTAGSARIASRLDLNNGGALELLNKEIKTATGRPIDGRGVFPYVCLSNIRTAGQRDAFFLNVVNGDFNAADFNRDMKIKADDVRRGCPTIVNGADEDAVSAAVAVQILTDKKLYNRLIASEE